MHIDDESSITSCVDESMLKKIIDLTLPIINLESLRSASTLSSSLAYV